ncbi:MAG: hypothetical protein U0787_04815 [Polyangia bacterium]
MQSRRKSDHGIHQRLGRLKGVVTSACRGKDIQFWYSIFDLFHTVALDISISGMCGGNSRVDHRTLQAAVESQSEKAPDTASGGLPHNDERRQNRTPSLRVEVCLADRRRSGIFGSTLPMLAMVSIVQRIASLRCCPQPKVYLSHCGRSRFR